MMSAPANGKQAVGTQGVQTSFDFITGISHRELMRVDEVCARLGVERDYVYDLIASGDLETHRKQGRERSSFLVTRRSVLAWLAKSADYVPADFVATLVELAGKLNQRERAELIQRLQSGK